MEMMLVEVVAQVMVMEVVLWLWYCCGWCSWCWGVVEVVLVVLVVLVGVVLFEVSQTSGSQMEGLQVIISCYL